MKGDPEETPGCLGQGKQRLKAGRGGKETLITTHQCEQQECLSQSGPISWNHPGAGPSVLAIAVLHPSSPQTRGISEDPQSLGPHLEELKIKVLCGKKSPGLEKPAAAYMSHCGFAPI